MAEANRGATTCFTDENTHQQEMQGNRKSTGDIHQDAVVPPESDVQPEVVFGQPELQAIPEMVQPIGPPHRSIFPETMRIERYKMDAVPRGKCIIISNKDFHGDAGQLRTRNGTDVDREKLRETFHKLGFLVQCYNNLTDHQIVRQLQELAMEDHSLYDCFVCCILSHGDVGVIFGVNGIPVTIPDITSLFRAQSCPSLAGKPKLFFLQACQGQERQTGFYHMETDAVTEGPGRYIPNESDFLIGFCTVPGFESYRGRDPVQGSWYIETLTRLLDKHSHRNDIHDILTRVNDEVGKRDARFAGNHVVYKQIPAPMYTLTKKVIFFRPGCRQAPQDSSSRHRRAFRTQYETI